MQNANCKMQNENVKFKIFGYEKEITEKSKKVYQEGKGSDSPGGFELERTREIN